MNIRWKYTLIIAVISIVSLSSFIALWLFQKNEADINAAQKGKAAAARIEKLLALKSGYFRKQANDYARWNAMVEYVRTKDKQWAKDNLEGSLSEFGSSGVYVIDTNKAVIYSSTDKPSLKNLYDIVDKNSLRVDKPIKMHFFATTKDGVVEFFGAPIQHSTDYGEDEKPSGYFLVVNSLSKKYIDELNDLGQAKISVEKDNNEDKDKEETNVIIKHIALKDINNKQIAFLHIVAPNNISKAIDEYAGYTIKLALAHIVILIAAFIFLMARYFTTPLEDITKALAKRDIDPIKDYLYKDNEYGKISRAIDDAFKSREKLKQLNEELERRIHDEVEKNRQKERILFQQSKSAALGELISLIAHQWRQPLNAVGLILQNMHFEYKNNMLTEKEMDEWNKKGMDIINSMSKTIDTFRSFYSPDVEKILFCIEKSIESAVEIVAAPFEELGIWIYRHYDGEHNIAGYKGELEQIILNILLNSRDAIISNDIDRGIINISVKTKEQSIVIEISDNGGGIADDLIDKIFDPYISTKYQSQGVGIGLYMAKQIVEKHHSGEISAANNETGATFTIRLPLG